MEQLPTLSRTESLILQMLIASGGELYGLQMVEGANGRLKRGTIYVTLSRMQDKQYVESRAEERPAPDRAPRRLYRATGVGERALAAWEAAREVWNFGEGLA